MAAGINIVKFVNGQDADTPTGPHVAASSTVSFTYVVTNTSGVALSNVIVSDDKLGAITSFTGDTNGNSLLDVAETWTYTKTSTALAGQQTNVGTVTAKIATTTVVDSDSANYFGDVPAVRIVKFVNGQDANTPTGPHVIAGGTVSFTYVVTNTGNVPLATVAVTDDKLGAITSFTGDTNGNSLLDLAETWTYTKTATALAGQQTNVGTVTAKDINNPPGTLANFSDPANYFGDAPAINIVKFVNGQDADTPTGPHVAVGSTVTFTHVVTNTGNVPLANVIVADNKLGTLTGFTGDTNGNGLLDLTEIWTYTKTAAALAGQQTNNGVVVARDAIFGATFVDSNPANYFGSVPPVITSDGGGDTATVFALERTTSVTKVIATDPDSPSLTYSVVGGMDAGKFQIDGSTGALSFIAAPNFDVPSDSDHNNIYVVQVRASDGSLFDDQLINVQVTNDPNVTSTVHWIRSVDVGAHPTGWLPAGIGDFNADGSSDLAWFNASNGDVDIWKLANGQWAGSSDVGPHPAGYQPAGFGDFNHDGTSDVFWYNAATRDAEVWKIANAQWAGSVDIGTHPAGYLPSGVGDFNDDGTSDVLWFNSTTRDAEIWKISNGHWAGSVDIGTHPAGYLPSGVGDFNGDGTSDVLWFNSTTRDAEIWKISNGQWAGSVDIGTHPAGWQPLGAADFNLDGVSDIAWYNPTINDIDIWLIKNGQWAGSVDVGTHPAGAVAVGVGDFDHNGVADIMWRDAGNGHIENWMLAFS